MANTSASWKRPWSCCFLVDSESDEIVLSQIGESTFKLLSSIEYVGSTGLDHLGLSEVVLADIRKVSPELLPETDLASVPTWLRWFAGRYGLYTPAALIHDRLIGCSSEGTCVEGVSAQNADRYFRFMLKELGVTFSRRWLMWSAVALRTRFYDGAYRRVSVIIWFFLAVAGIAALVFSVASSSPLLFIGSLFAPVVAAVFWGRQFSAGIIAAYIGVPWILPPAIFVGIFYSLYMIVDRGLSIFDSKNS